VPRACHELRVRPTPRPAGRLAESDAPSGEGRRDLPPRSNVLTSPALPLAYNDSLYKKMEIFVCLPLFLLGPCRLVYLTRPSSLPTRPFARSVQSRRPSARCRSSTATSTSSSSSASRPRI